MYHCRILIHLAGISEHTSEVLRATPVPRQFSIAFSEGALSDANVAANAEMIIVQTEDSSTAADTVRKFCAAKKSGCALVVIAPAGTELFSEEFSAITNVWNLPMSDAELRFRFSRLFRYLQIYCVSRQQENYLNAVIDTSPNMIWFKNREGIHEKVNDSFCAAVNKSKDQVQGQTHGYIWGVDGDDPACVASDNYVMESKETLVSEETITTSSGKRLLTTYKSPLYDLDGSVKGTVGLGVDVTREREFEREIISQNRMFEKIFTSIDCGVMTHSYDGKEVFSANEAALRILGYDSVEEMTANGFNYVADSVLDEDKPLLRGAIQSLKNEGDTVSVEYRVLDTDGSIRHVMGTIKLLRNNGELYYQRFLLDCTEQRERDHENEQLIQALSRDYNLVCYFNFDDGDGHVLRHNNCKNIGFSEEKLSGDFSLDELLREYVENAVYEEDRGVFVDICTCENLKKTLSGTNNYYLTYRIEFESTMRYFQVKAVRVGSTGAVLGFRCIDDEIRKELEKQDLLENALKQANRASSAKSAFLSNMSHDIRTPMNAIIGFTTLALSHLDNIERVEECLKKISISGDHLLELINNVLDMSRIESGKVFLEEKPASLSEITNGLKNILQSQTAEKEQQLTINTVNVYDENIICDKLRLNQILLNLLSNSIKYTPKGGHITFRISENAGAREGYANYEFVVKDDGIGMDEEFLAKVFEPFERERNTTLSGIQGTGLGMAITKNLVDLMNGTIEVNSTKGAGTEVILSFLFKLDGDESELIDCSALKGRRALVVDENREACESVSGMLRMLMMRGDCALSAQSAIDLAKKNVGKYSLVIIDHEMAWEDSIKTVEDLRAVLGENVPIIMQTARDKAEFEAAAKEAGVRAFCSKPLFMSELRGCLAELFSGEVRVTKNDNTTTDKIRSGRILLVEDNELNREIAETLLTEAGFEVEAAENGSEAVEMVKAGGAGRYKVILMDIQMPVMNGYEATKAIRALDDAALNSIPIIAMTANAFEEDKQTAINYGMNAHIAKPIKIKNLFDTLDSII